MANSSPLFFVLLHKFQGGATGFFTGLFGTKSPKKAAKPDEIGIGHFANILGKCQKTNTRYCVLVVDFHHKMCYN